MRYLTIAIVLAASPAPAQTGASPAATPGAEAEMLGKRIAARGTLAALLPLMVAKDSDELVAQHPELDAAGQARLRAAAAATAAAAIDRLTTAVGHQYATRLSFPDLRAIAAFGDTPAAAAWRAAEPATIAAAIGGLGDFDLKRAAWQAYCRDPASRCPPAP